MSQPGAALDLVRQRVAAIPGVQFAEGEQLTVLLGDGEHRLALSIAVAPSGNPGMGAACSCGRWDAAQFGASRWILERIADEWSAHLYRSEVSGGR